MECVSEVSTVGHKSKRLTPAQDQIKEGISLLEAEFDVAVRRRDSLAADGKEQALIVKLKKNIEEKKKELQKNKSTINVQKNTDNHKN